MYKAGSFRLNDGKSDSSPCSNGQRKACWGSFHARFDQATLSSLFEITEEEPLLILFGKSML